MNLQTLTAYASELTGGQKGLLACTKLNVLDCEDSEFGAESASSHFCIAPDKPPAMIPEQLSKLTALTLLTLAFDNDVDSNLVMDISWVYKLTSLKCLQMRLAGSFEIANEVTQLQHLTKLNLKASSEFDQWHAMCLVNWQFMQSLQCIEVSGRVQFDAHVLQLTALCCFSEVTLCSDCLLGRPGAHLSRLAYELAVHFPHVLVKMDGKLVSSLRHHKGW